MKNFNEFMDHFLGVREREAREGIATPRTEEDDPTPWCAGCGSMTKAGCDCGPIAENE